MEKRKIQLVVVGSGAAGIMAALSAAYAGVSCVILEKGASLASSNGSRAGGPALADTVIQERENETVTVDKLFSHMYGFSNGTVNAGLLHRAVSSGRRVEALLQESGVEMYLWQDAYGLGFRARHFFKENGLKRWQPLADSFQKLGGQIVLHCTAQHLRRDGDSIIVEAEDNCSHETFEWEAEAVVIATGGYLGNPEMMAEHFGKINVIPLGSPLSDGGGIRMAKEIGGLEDRNWGICANEFGGANHKSRKKFGRNMQFAVAGGLLVNRQGRRFINEQLLSDKALSVGGEATLREGLFYAVVDEEMYQTLQSESIYKYYGCPEEWYVGRVTHAQPSPIPEEDLDKQIEEGWAFRGSIEAIAEQAGLKELPETVRQYNEMCCSGKDVLFGKSAYLLKAIRDDCCYVFEYEPSAWCTFGGVKTDEFCCLLDCKQQKIPGVFVAGVDNGSCYPQPYYDNEGAALGLAFTTGVIAGEEAARYILKS